MVYQPIPNNHRLGWVPALAVVQHRAISQCTTNAPILTSRITPRPSKLFLIEANGKGISIPHDSRPYGAFWRGPRGGPRGVHDSFHLSQIMDVNRSSGPYVDISLIQNIIIPLPFPCSCETQVSPRCTCKVHFYLMRQKSCGFCGFSVIGTWRAV